MSIPPCRFAICTAESGRYSLQPGLQRPALALVLLSSSHLRTLPLGIAVLQFVQFYEVDFGALFAGLVIVMLPTLVCYIVLQEQITKGITVGAVKG